MVQNNRLNMLFYTFTFINSISFALIYTRQDEQYRHTLCKIINFFYSLA